MTRTAEMADVVLPGTASWCEADGTVTNSERRVQRVRKALEPPGEARDDTWILCELARRLGHDWGHPTAEEIWDELRSLSPMHGGMGYDRLELHRGLQWPCPNDAHPGSLFLHERLWADPVEGPRAPFSVVEAKPPFEALDADYPIRLTTGRRLESFNTGAQSGRYRSPLHRGEALELSPEDAERLEVAEGEVVRVSSRRGAVEAPVRVDDSLRAGLAFMSFHFPDEVDVNQLTIDATDPKSGTAEFKAAAIRVDRLDPDAARRARAGGGPRVVDIRLIAGAEPTPSERGALDEVLGPPGSGWEGGARLTGSAGNTTAGGHTARARRHLLLPALWALQERIGWISPGGLNEICRRLTVPPADAYGVATFYALFALDPRPPRVVHVCEDVACRCHGSQELIAQLEERFGPEGELSGDGSATWYRSPCLGRCDRAPAAMVTDAGDEPRRARPGARDRSLGARPARGRPTGSVACSAAPAGGRSHPAAAPPRRRGRSVEHRRLPRARGLRRASPRRRDGPGGRAAGGEGLEARRPRRCGLPDGRQVGGGRAPARPAALPRVQRRRVRARDLQGPRAARRRPVRGDRGDDHRRLRDGLRARLPVPPRRVSRGPSPAGPRARRGARPRLPGRRRHGRGLLLRHRGHAWGRRLHLRRGDRDLRVDRGEARRAAQQAAVPGRGRPVRQADRGQQRRDARQRARRRARLRTGVRRDRDRRLDRHEAPLRVRATSHGRGRTRCASARRCARCSTWQGASPASGGSRPC